MNKILYIVTVTLVVLSFIKDKTKTKKALLKGWKSFSHILPMFFGVLVFVGLIIAIFNAELISKVIGSESGWMGTMIAGVFGTLAMIPSFVAFPMAEMLLYNGAGYMQVGAFISTLFWVQLASIPIEIKYFGKRVTITRNIVAFLFSFIVAKGISIIMGTI
jgi:uncharacterized membrane protein YraQ (UPF0718 family)